MSYEGKGKGRATRQGDDELEDGTQRDLGGVVSAPSAHMVSSSRTRLETIDLLLTSKRLAHRQLALPLRAHPALSATPTL